MDYDRYLKKVTYNSIEETKNRNFKDRLEKDYNREEIVFNSKKYKAIITPGRLDVINMYYNISANSDTGLKAGSVFYWTRLDSNFMVVFQRYTEKNYFNGRIYETKYQLSWFDEFGNRISEYAVIKSMTDIIVPKTYSSQNASFFYDAIDGSIFMYLALNENTKNFVKRYKIVKIKERSWKIVGWDDISYDNLIAIRLVEVLNNSEIEASDLPDAEVIQKDISITSNIDNITELPLNTELELSISTKLKGEIVDELYEIKTKNCSYNKAQQTISFNTIGISTIKIIGLTSGKAKEYSINVSISDSKLYTASIIGKNSIKNGIAYTYKISLLINGESAEVDNSLYKIIWQHEDKITNIKNISADTILFKTSVSGAHLLKAFVYNLQEEELTNCELLINSEDLV